MDKTEFSQVRRHLGKTQAQIANLLGVSPKAVQSFEQGWRYIPTHVERQMLFLVFLRSSKGKGYISCWSIRKCPVKVRRHCPAWEFKVGHICWFINGTICQGVMQQNWQKKMKLCRQCEVFGSILPSTREYD
jgi:hypothetical protein